MYLIGNSYIFSSIICFYGFVFCVGFKFLDLCIMISIVHSHPCAQVPEFMPPQGTSSGGWFRKVSGLIVAWKLGEVHRIRRLLQGWEEVPRVKAYVAALVGYVKMYGWPKNLEGEYGLNTCTGLRSYWLQQSLGGEKKTYQTVRTSILKSKLNTVTISIQKSRLKIKQSPFQFRNLNWKSNSWHFNSEP